MCTNKLETKLNVLLINYSFIHFAKNSCGLKYIFFFSCLLDSSAITEESFCSKLVQNWFLMLYASDSGKHSNNRIIKNFFQ